MSADASGTPAAAIRADETQALPAGGPPRSFADRLNPVLVKELRASLRGRAFRIQFLLVALGSIAIAMMRLGSLSLDADSAGVGRAFLQPAYACLCVAVLGFVPIMAYLSMGSEHDEHTFELLEISNLRPRQIVLGKLLAAGVETVLYTTSFLPIFVFAFLLRGVDIVNTLSVVVCTLAASLSAAALALALSSLTRLRAVRVFLLAALAGGCLGLVVLASNVAEWWAFSTWRSGGVGLDEVAVAFGVIVGFGVLGVVVATERITHAEENHSTAPRVLLLGALIVTQVWMGILAYGKHVDREDVALGTVFQIVGLAVFQVFFATEAEALPRRVSLFVPARSWRAILATPFLPGGGRAVLFHLVCGALILAGDAVSRSFLPTSSAWFRGLSDEPERMACLAAWFVALTGSISLVASRWTNPRPGGAAQRQLTLRRWLTRLLVVLAFFAALLGPPLLRFLISGRTGSSSHALNPFWVMWDARPRGPGGASIVSATIVAACLVLAANLPRLLASVREVLKASRERRARQAVAA